MRRFWAVLAVFLCVAVVAACGGDDGGDGGDGRASGDDSDQIEVDDEPVEEEDLSEEEVIEQVQDFWDDNAEDADLDWEDVDDDRISSIDDEDTLPDSCFFEPLPLEQVEYNAVAIGCPEGPTVLWDPELIDDLTDDYGETGPAVVFAHEFGHVVQIEQGVIAQLESIIKENQADCYAGAWVAEQIDEEYGPFADPASVDRAVAAIITLRDPVGSDPNDPLAHGSGFDRVRAFQDGINQGVEYCYGYLDDPPFIDEIPFGSAEDEANQGNLPFDEVTDLVEDDLDDYFGDNVDDFDEPDDPFELYDEDDLEDLHEEIGDGAVATIFGLTWAQAAQEAADEDTDGEGPFLQRACLVGTWLGDILQDQRDGVVERDSGVSLSPGDLDEAITTLLRISDDEMSAAGVAFESVFDMRQGVFGDIDDCRLGD